MTEGYGADWLAMLLGIAGIWIVGSKNRWGFVLCAASQVIWAGLGVWKGLYGLTCVAIPVIVIHGRNWFKWGRNGKES